MRQHANRTFVFNNFNFGKFCVLESIERGMLPAVSRPVYEIPGRYGVELGQKKIGASVIVCRCRIIRHEWHEVDRLKSVLASKLLADKPEVLKVRDSAFFDLAVVDGAVDFERIKNTGGFTINFLNPFGVRFGQEFEVALAEGSQKIFVGGTFPVYPVFEGIVKDPTVKIKLNDKFFSFTDLTIDTDLKIFYKDAFAPDRMTNMSVLSRRSYLLPGENSIEVTGAEGVMTWREAWI